MLPAGLGSLFGFKIARGFLGAAEPGLTPGGIKVVTEWFPRAERSLARGDASAGGNEVERTSQCEYTLYPSRQGGSQRASATRRRDHG